MEIWDLGGVLEIALNKDLTFYDSAYIHVAEIHGLKLVSEDKTILSSYPKAISVSVLLRSLA